MATYMVLVKWTEEGARNVKDTFDRVQQAQALAGRFGAKLHTYHWLQGGEYDFVTLVDAPDDETAATVALGASRSGAIRTQTMRAFDEEEMKRIVQRLG